MGYWRAAWQGTNMPEFDKNAAYIWVLVGLGLALPLLLAVYTNVRVKLAKRRLERLQRLSD